MKSSGAGRSRRAQAEAALAPGNILYLSISFPHEITANDKYLVVAGHDNNQPLLLKINSSDVLPENRRRLQERQFRIRPEKGYPFLRDTSYLDCGTVWYILSRAEIISQLFADYRRMVGQVLPAHENEIVRLTELSKSISRYHKHLIAQAFQP